MLLKLQCNR